MNARLEMYGETDVGAREYNEDSFLTSLDARVALVVDGMGGVCTGVVASRIAVAAIACYLESEPRERDDARRLAGAIQVANELIHEAATRESLPESAIGRAVYERLDSTARAIHDAASDRLRMTLQGMGATIVACLVGDDAVHIAHVGDARAYRLRGGEIQQLTEDHSLLNEYRKVSQPQSDEIETSPLRDVVTRALGLRETVQIDLRSVSFQAGDVILLCSDGVWKRCSPQSLLRCVTTNWLDLRRATSEVLKEAKTNGGEDNRTVVLLRLE